MGIVVNHHVELTQAEKDEAHAKAKKRAEDEAYKLMKGTKKPTLVKKEEEKTTNTLF